MNQLAVIRALEKDPAALGSAAAAMYRIREPMGSTIRSFEEISKNKKERNAELALQLLSAMLTRYPNPEHVKDRGEVITYLGEQMYKTLAPRKSQDFPFEDRTVFARSYYYEGKAEDFLYEFLLPLAQTHQSVPSSAELGSRSKAPTLHSSNRSKQEALGAGTVPGHGSAQNGPEVVPIGAGGTRSRPDALTLPTSTPRSASHPTRETSKPTQPSSSPSGNAQFLSLISMLLVVIIVLLVVLVIRSF